MRTRRRAIDDLRLAIACLPRATRVAMLDGIERNPIIVGAYSTGDGICPMLAAHRAGGRTSFIAFAEAWDRFAEGTAWRRRARPATRRELLILRAHLEASLLEEEGEPEGGLSGVIAEHRALVARRTRPGDPDLSRGRHGDPDLSRGRHGEPDLSRGRPGEPDPRRTRPGDPDRSHELRRAGWAWSRLFRRYDDYAEAVTTFSHTDEPAAAGVPSAV